MNVPLQSSERHQHFRSGIKANGFDHLQFEGFHTTIDGSFMFLDYIHTYIHTYIHRYIYIYILYTYIYTYTNICYIYIYIHYNIRISISWNIDPRESSRNSALGRRMLVDLGQAGGDDQGGTYFLHFLAKSNYSEWFLVKVMPETRIRFIFRPCI